MQDPLILLPPMMSDARVFLPQILALGQDRAIMVAPVSGASSVGALAAAVLDGAPQRFALAGLALGGIVAMEVLRRAPERVTRLALMDTNCLAEPPQMAAEREPNIIGAQTGRLAEIMREEIKPRCLAPGPKRIEVLNLVMEMALALGPQVFVAQNRALQRRPDQQKTLRQIKVPALVLCGEHDELYPVKRHAFLAELIPGARLVVVRDAGHLPTLENPEAVTEALTDWLAAPLVLR